MDRGRIDDALNQWLRDAHAMESQAETMLAGEVSRLENYPDLRARMERHMEESRSQRERLEACLARRGASTSAIKDMAGRFTATMQAASGVFAADEVAKGAMAGYTFEHYEISAYTMLVAGAEEAGDTETARVCREICAEEEEMAAWMKEALPRIARAYLQREAAEMTEAKR